MGRLRRRLGRDPVVLAPRDCSWTRIAPGFDEASALASSGVPVQIAAERRYDRAPDAGAVVSALAGGQTVFLPQVHQVLPRVARLMVALRAALLGPFREECSFLFVVQGRGREGMGLHHDGDVDALWLQLDGRRTVAIGPPVPPGTPEDLEVDRLGPGWRTTDLPPGSLFYMPPRTPHRVICRTRSLALSLTWRLPPRGRRTARQRAESLAQWDVASGRVGQLPQRRADTLWTQVPAVALEDRAGLRLLTPDAEIVLPASARALARRLAVMPALEGAAAHDPDVARLVGHGVLGDEDLPMRIVPDEPSKLDGWRFA